MHCGARYARPTDRAIHSDVLLLDGVDGELACNLTAEKIIVAVEMIGMRRVGEVTPDKLLARMTGEPCMGGTVISASIRPAALRVRVSSLCA